MLKQDRWFEKVLLDIDGEQPGQIPLTFGLLPKILRI